MKVVSYCLWGNNPKYTVGAVRNAELVKSHYPDWQAWFYVGSSTSKDVVASLVNEGAKVIEMEEPGDWRGMFWRFYPASDPNVEVMISRDCDSRISQREVDAVNDWLDSGLPFHIMRDHPLHHKCYILAGMFGTKKNPNDYLGLKQGYEFNLPVDPANNQPSSWWENLNSLSDTTFPVGFYNTPLGAGLGPNSGPIPFTYIESLKQNDILDGDLCEWNESEQKERVISKLYHKYRFNPFVLSVTEPPRQSPSNMFGYYYQPHYPIKIRDYSDYIETGSKQLPEVGIPDYAFYSQKTDSFIWRDIYQYGFIPIWFYASMPISLYGLPIGIAL
jgi:hypothetical protein